MKILTSQQVLIRAAAVLAVLVAGQALAQDKHVDVSVQDMGGQHKLVFSGSLCPSNPEPGCIMVERGNSPMLSWALTGAAAMEWQFVGMQFSPDGVSWGGVPLADCTMEDFALSESDRYDGQASTAQIVAGGKRIQIRDHNRNVCVTHYKLTARSNSGEVIDSDPIVDNKGSN